MSCVEKIQKLEDELVQHISKLDSKFLSAFIPADPSHKPADYEHEVKAFCVLSHAAFEEFIEEVSMQVMSDAIDIWKTRRLATDPIISLCLYYGLTITSIEQEDADQSSCFDLLREAIDESKKRHSNAIHNNHGFSLKYLRSALTPIFLNIPTDFRLVASLQTLAAARGSFAHSSARNAEYSSKPTKKVRDRAIAPEQAKEVVSDCLDLCRNIGANARALFHQIYLIQNTTPRAQSSNSNPRNKRVTLREKLHERRAEKSASPSTSRIRHRFRLNSGKSI